jgi:hypothetical protein
MFSLVLSDTEAGTDVGRNFAPGPSSAKLRLTDNRFPVLDNTHINQSVRILKTLGNLATNLIAHDQARRYCRRHGQSILTARNLLTTILSIWQLSRSQPTRDVPLLRR